MRFTHGHEDMRVEVKTIILVAAIAVPLALMPRVYDLVMQFDRDLHASLRDLNIGTDKSRVFTLLGEPITSDTECCLPQSAGFESEFARAKESNAVEYFLWRNGVNWYYCIGFDKNNKLVTKLEGGS